MSTIRLEFNFNIDNNEEKEKLMSAYCDGSLHNIILDTIKNNVSHNGNIDTPNQETMNKLNYIVSLLETQGVSNCSTNLQLEKEIIKSPLPKLQQDSVSSLAPKRRVSNGNGILGRKTLSRI